MSLLKRIVILILLVIAGFLIWLLFIPDELPSPDFSSDNKVEVLSYVITNRYAREIREAGYVIPPDSVIRRAGIDNLEIPGELDLSVSPPSSNDERVVVLFRTRIQGKETQVSYFLDKHFNLTYSKYRVEDEDGVKKAIEVDPSTEKALVVQVQKELNQFLDRMKEKLDSK